MEKYRRQWFEHHLKSLNIIKNELPPMFYAFEFFTESKQTALTAKQFSTLDLRFPSINQITTFSLRINYIQCNLFSPCYK